MPAKKAAMIAVAALSRPMEDGGSAIFSVTPKGGLVVCRTTAEGGKMVKPRDWLPVIEEDSAGAVPIEAVQFDIVPLRHNFLDIHIVLRNGDILMQRIGFHQGAWVCAGDWIKVLDAKYAKTHNLGPASAFDAKAAKPAAPDYSEKDPDYAQAGKEGESDEGDEGDEEPDPAKDRDPRAAAIAKRKELAAGANARS